MNERKRHFILWRMIILLISRGVKWRFNYSYEKIEPERPSLIISNHVTNYDAILVGMSFLKKQVYFVASEHLFRKKLVTKLLKWVFAPLARRKGSNGMDTAMACMRTLRDGYSVCIFGEGETTWDGLTQEIVPSTGNLARLCNAPLITYRLEGGYLTAPRWGKGIRRGKMRGHVVNTYTPEQLRAMKPEEITACINRDIYDDEWARQKQQMQRFRGKNRADLIEIALFMCPKCKGVGTVYGEGSHVRCSCGFDALYTEYGTFEPAAPFENMAQWNAWQHQCLKSGDYDHANANFVQDNMELYEVGEKHSETLLDKGDLTWSGDAFQLGKYSFPLRAITNLALVQRRLIVFTFEGKYYEMRADRPCCLRKYLAIWKNANEQTEETA